MIMGHRTHMGSGLEPTWVVGQNPLGMWARTHTNLYQINPSHLTCPVQPEPAVNLPTQTNDRCAAPIVRGLGNG